MLRSYVIVALRALTRERAYAAINVGGLAIGLAICLVIGLYVIHELSYDRFHEKADRIYRVNMLMEESNSQVWPSVVLPIGPLLQDVYPEIEQSVRVQDEPNALVQSDLLRAREDRFLYVEPAFFDLFDFAVIAGDAVADLAKPYTVAITQKTAERYFGGDDPLGEELLLNNEQSYEVVAVVEDAPATSHVHFDLLASFASRAASGRISDEWRSLAFTYVLLREGVTAGGLHEKLAAFSKKYISPKMGGAGEVTLLPLTDIHLRAGTDIQPQGDIRYVYLFSVIALLILFIAGINYMNLATARSARRAREVGVRKVIGAQKRQLVAQFMGESLVCVLLALPLALLIAFWVLPYFGDLVQRPLEMRFSFGLVIALLGAAAVVGAAAGSYPALVLSSYRPSAVVKGKARPHGAQSLRKGLVIFQFTASAALIASTVVIHQQLRFIQASRLGFDEERVLVIETHDELEENAAAFKEELLRHPGVGRVSLAYSLPSRPFALSFFESSNVAEYTPPAGESTVIVNSTWVDADFIATLGLDITAGRGFSPEFRSDEEDAVIINETAQRQFGWKKAVGKKLDGRTVIGVVRDFHVGSFREEIEPTLLFLSSNSATRAIVKLRPGDVPRTLSLIEETWSSFVPSVPFEYSFLDEDFAAMHRADERLGQLFLGFAGLTVLVACLGLFGLVAFTTESRTKEIGIRKVLGASTASILQLLTSEFTVLLFVAFVIAAPLAYIAMRRWLAGFAYHVEIGPGVFIAAAVLTIMTAAVAVSYQAIRAATADPVDSLRYE